MKNHNVSFDNHSAVGLMVMRAVLVYGQAEGSLYGGGGRLRAATIHNVTAEGCTAPSILPGRPMTLADLEEIITGLHAACEAQHGQQEAETRESRLGFLSPNILACNMSKLVWWCPAQRRPLYFQAKEESKASAFKSLSGKQVNHPALVFMATERGLSIFAVRTKRRPTLQTPLYQAPYYNVNDAGFMCTGSVKFPRILAPHFTRKFEEAFFESIGTHSTARRLVKHPGKYLGFCREMRSPKAAPSKFLLPLGLTVRDLLEKAQQFARLDNGQPFEDIEEEE